MGMISNQIKDDLELFHHSIQAFVTAGRQAVI